MAENFHIEDRVHGRIVAAGQIDGDGRVIWEETEVSVSEELSDLAAQIEKDYASGFTAVSYDDLSSGSSLSRMRNKRRLPPYPVPMPEQKWDFANTQPV